MGTERIRKIRRLLMIVGIVCCLYGLCVLVVIGTRHWFNFCFLIMGIALIVLSAISPKLCLLPPGMKRVLLFTSAVLFIAFAAFECRIMLFANQTPESDADYVIVLGAKVNGSSPSLEYSVRLDAASNYLENNPESKVLTTGGKGSDEDLSEGAAGKKRLIESGIDSSRIIAEEKSTSTYENLLYAKGLIEDDGGDVSKDRVVIISSGFHLYRASKYARAAGYGNTSYYGRSGLPVLIPHYYVREFAAYVFDLMKGCF